MEGIPPGEPHSSRGLPFPRGEEASAGSARIAGLRARMGAFLIDQAVLVFVGAASFVLLSILAFLFGGPEGESGKHLFRARNFWALGITALFYAHFHRGKRNGTPGKRLFGLSVRSVRDEPISFRRALLRFLVFYFPLVGITLIAPAAFRFSAIGSWIEKVLGAAGTANVLLLLLDRPSHRGLHDLAAGTVVVRSAPEGAPRVVPAGRRTWASVVLILVTLHAGWFAAKMGRTDPTPEERWNARLTEKLCRIPGVQDVEFEAYEQEGEEDPLLLVTVSAAGGRDGLTLATDVAEALLEEIPYAPREAPLRIVLKTGIRVGFLDFGTSGQVEKTVLEWRERVRKRAPRAAGSPPP